MPVGTSELNWRTLSRTLNELRRPNSFMTDFLFGGNRVTKATSTVEMGLWIAGRRMAPFVLPGANAIAVPGVSRSYTQFEFPNIRLKKPIDYSRYAETRTPGSNIFIDNSERMSAMNEAILKDLQYMKDQVDETIEWMACQLLTGSLTAPTFSGNDQTPDYFTVDFQRPGAHTITLATTDRWSEPQATATQTPRETLNTVQKLMDAKGFQVTDVILGKTAAAWFEKHWYVVDILNKLHVTPGGMNLDQTYSDKGARFLGRAFGVNWWEYSRTTVDPSGNSVDLIGQTKAHFICKQPISGFQLQFGPIYDARAVENGAIVTEYFSKSWVEEDPGHRIHLVQSRPMPWVERPEATATVTVV